MPTLAEQVRDALGFGDVKRFHRNERKAAKRARRAARRRQIKCFWSWPLRHEWGELEDENGRKHRCCVACGKPI